MTDRELLEKLAGAVHDYNEARKNGGFSRQSITGSDMMAACREAQAHLRDSSPAPDAASIRAAALREAAALCRADDGTTRRAGEWAARDELARELDALAVAAEKEHGDG